jgi:hypothetical protein
VAHQLQCLPAFAHSSSSAAPCTCKGRVRGRKLEHLYQVCPVILRWRGLHGTINAFQRHVLAAANGYSHHFSHLYTTQAHLQSALT